MTEELFDSPTHKADRAREAVAGELLFEVVRGEDRFWCELRERDEEFGAEARLFRNEEFLYSRGFYPSLNPTRTPRDLAVDWAEEERKALEKVAPCGN